MVHTNQISNSLEVAWSHHLSLSTHYYIVNNLFLHSFFLFSLKLVFFHIFSFRWSKSNNFSRSFFFIVKTFMNQNIFSIIYFVQRALITFCVIKFFFMTRILWTFILTSYELTILNNWTCIFIIITLFCFHMLFWKSIHRVETSFSWASLKVVWFWQKVQIWLGVFQWIK